MSKDKDKDLERKLKTEIFKRMVLGKRDPNVARTDDEKADLFAKLVAGKGESKKLKQTAPIQKNPFDEMKDLMRDPFGSKEWAKSKQIQKKSANANQPDLIEMVIAEPTEEELQAFWASRPEEE